MSLSAQPATIFLSSHCTHSTDVPSGCEHKTKAHTYISIAKGICYCKVDLLYYEEHTCYYY